jgi:hypothetical protein
VQIVDLDGLKLGLGGGDAVRRRRDGGESGMALRIRVGRCHRVLRSAQFDANAGDGLVSRVRGSHRDCVSRRELPNE